MKSACGSLRPGLNGRPRLLLVWLILLAAAVGTIARPADQTPAAGVLLTTADPSLPASPNPPAVIRLFCGITNDVAAQFRAAFAAARSNFVSELQDTFHAAVLDHATMTSPDFGYLVTAYNFDHPVLPVTSRLAMDWAYGRDGAAEADRWLEQICAVMRQPIRPDDWPAGFDPGDVVRLVAVGSPDEVVNPARLAGDGPVVAPDALTTLAQAQTQLRREFTSEDEQLLARALAAWVQPNCLADPVLTQAARQAAARPVPLAEDPAPGQAITPAGTAADGIIKDVMDRWQQTAASQPVPVPPAGQAAPESVPVAAPADAGASVAALRLPVMTAPPARTPAFSVPQRRLAMVAAFITLLVIIARQFAARPQPVSTVPAVARATPLKAASGLSTELAPQILQVVRQAFVHELAGQRRDLLAAQQAAADEVIQLVQRMDELQVAMQERLRGYEAQIQQLEAELTARKEENRQLIRLKIQMIRHQVDLETRPERVELN